MTAIKGICICKSDGAVSLNDLHVFWVCWISQAFSVFLNPQNIMKNDTQLIFLICNTFIKSLSLLCLSLYSIISVVLYVYGDFLASVKIILANISLKIIMYPRTFTHSSHQFFFHKKVLCFVCLICWTPVTYDLNYSRLLGGTHCPCRYLPVKLACIMVDGLSWLLVAQRLKLY